MTNIFKFDMLKVSKFFRWDVYRLLMEAGLKTLKDVIDFEEIDTLIPQQTGIPFKFSTVYYSFCFLEEIKKKEYQSKERSFFLFFNLKNAKV